MSETSVGKFFISFGIDASSFTEEMVRAEQQASGSAGRIKDKLASIASSLGSLRTEARQLQQSLSSATNFNLRGTESLDKLHDVLFGVRAAGTATDKTLDDLSLRFEAASRGARTYAQALDRIASDKGASQSVRDLARALSEEAKEASYSATQLEKRLAAVNRQIAQQSRTFASSIRQKQKQDDGHAVPENAAASAFVRGAEGSLSIRAGERFLTGTLGLGSALQSIFPVVGGLAMVDILTNLIDKTQEWKEKLQQFHDAPKLIAAAFRESNDEFRIGNEELALMNAKLENDIAVLQGKPRNSLKEAIAEATLEASKLAEALNKDVEALYKLLQENDVGGLARILGNQAGTSDIKQLVGGQTGVGGLRDQLAAISDESAQKRAAIAVGTTKKEQKASKAALDAVNSEERARTEKALSDALKTVNAELSKSIDLEAKRKSAANTPAAKPGASGNVLGAAVQNAQRDQQTRVVDSERRIAELRGVRTRLTEELTRSRLTATNIQDKTTKEGLESQRSSEALDAPFRSKISELGGELEKLKASLNAIGQTETAKTLAKGFGDAQAEIAKLNTELANHHQALTLDQQVALLTSYDEIESTKAEESFRSKFEQTTNSISERISSLRNLTAAVGQGSAAQRNATVENQLSQEFSAEFRDPELLRQRQPQIQQRRVQLRTEFDQQQGLQNTQALDKLSDQIGLENALAAAEQQGVEAVRQVTLANRAANLEKDKGADAGRKLADAERSVSDAQEHRKNLATISQIEQETQATNRLADAQSQGAKAVRQAQLQNQIADIKRNTPAGPDQTRQIQAVTDQSNAQHQQEVVSNALQTGIAFKNQLQSINEQIAALEKLRTTQGDSLEIEISLKSLEEQRVDVLSRQSLVFGNARDGLRAYFSEMATGTQSAAQQVHDTLGHAFESLNDTLARLVSGQKVSWASFFQSISANLAKMSLQNLESQFAKKFLPPSGQSSSAGGQQQGGGVLGKIFSLFGGFRETGGPVSADQWHVVGEDGPEIFVPGSKGTVVPNKQLKLLAHLFEEPKGKKRNPSAVQFPDANAEADKETAANEVSLAHKTPRAFNRTKTASKLSDVSLPNKPAGNQWADVIGFAQLGLKTLATASSSSGEGGSDTAGDLGSSGEGSGGLSGASDPNENYNLTPTESGLILREPKTFADLGAQDQANLGDFNNSELGQLNNSSEGTYPDLGMQKSAGVLSGPGQGSGSNSNTSLNLGILGASVGLGIIQMIMNRPKDHHHKAGQAYSIPNFNGAFADGGDVKGGMTHLVGERGPELFVPKSDGTIIPHHKLSSIQQFSTGSAKQMGSSAHGGSTQKGFAGVSSPMPFGGYRATGGDVDPGNAYMIGEQGPELWTPPATGGSIVPSGDLSRVGSGAGMTIYQDNRGSDTALMEQKTRQGLQAAHNAAVRTSFKAYQEFQKRTPPPK